MGKKIYVGNLSYDTSDAGLNDLFQAHGKVVSVKTIVDRDSGRSKGFAFVQMNTVEEAQRAVTELHDKEFLGRKLLVSGAKSSEHHSAS